MKYQDSEKPFIPDRTKLPLHEPIYKAISARRIEEAPQPPERFIPTAPKGAPNVLLVLIDDMGFGASSAFGGPIKMPASERLSNKGLKFNRFHTTALCSPTRTALLSGYNHHSNNMGMITETGTAYPGNLSTRPKSVTPLARVLKDNGYSTAQFGKCHEVPTWETSAIGPFDHWPTFSGFEKFYGFIGAEANQYSPDLYDGITPVDIEPTDDYHLSEDLADRCIEWIKMQKELAPEKPFFTYLAFGATHAPHQVPEEYRNMFKGEFDAGWDVMREETLARMKALGIVPEDTQLADKPKAIKDWDTLSEAQKKLYSRQMEVYAGFSRHADDQVGRVIDTIEELDIMDDTVIIYILGDNGASAEGHMDGVLNENSSLNMVDEPLEYVLENMGKLGTEYAYNHYSAAWAVALDAPFMWTKIVASNFGGTRNGLIVHYPKKFKNDVPVRRHFSHAIDIAPTILDICEIPIPMEVDGIEQRPMEGVSMVPALEDPQHEEIRTTQYFNIIANNGIYHDGWFAGVVAAEPWDPNPKEFNTKWELYNIEDDYSCSHDLSDEMPEKLNEMIEYFYQEAEKYNVLPIDTRGQSLVNADIAKRPTLVGHRKSITLNESFRGLSENTFLNLKNKSFTVTVEVEVKEGYTDGVLLSQGGRFGGDMFFIKDGKPCYHYNYVSLERYEIRSDKRLEAGRNQIRYEFKYDGGGIGLGGTLSIYINNQKVAEGRIDKTMGYILSLDEKINVGCMRGTPVSEEIQTKDSKFQGKLYAINVKID